MKLINNKLYLTMLEMVECGFVEARLHEAKCRGTKRWSFIDDPDDKRRVLVEFEALTETRKEVVERRFGNPYDHVVRKPILQLVDSMTCFKDNEYFLKYRYMPVTDHAEMADSNGKALPIDRVNQYTRAVKWLKMIGNVLGDKHILRKELHVRVKDFFVHVTELVNLEKERGKTEGYTGLDVLPGSFPATYQRLLARVERYQREGAVCLVDERYGNKNAAKLGKVTNMQSDEKKESQTEATTFELERYHKQVAVIRAIGRMHNNFDAAQVARMANLVFERNGWETVSASTIRNLINDNKHILTPDRQGKRAYMSDVAMQVKGGAPQVPMQYWTMDVQCANEQRNKDEKRGSIREARKAVNEWEALQMRFMEGKTNFGQFAQQSATNGGMPPP